MLSDAKNKSCCSVGRPHSPRAVRVRERFHENGEWSLALRKENYPDEQRGGGQQTSAGATACPKHCAWSDGKQWNGAEGSCREVARDHHVEEKRGQIMVPWRSG